MSYHNLLDCDLAYHSLEHLTVTRAVYYLTYIFDCGTHEIHSGQDVGTPIQLASNKFASLGHLASRARIWFWGGPPGEEEWYQGTLLTMLIDKLFYCVVSGYDDVVRKFLEVLNGSCRDQIGSTESEATSCALLPPPAS